MNTKPSLDIENSRTVPLNIKSENGHDWVRITLPIVTVSEANGGKKKSFKFLGKTRYKSEHWSKKNNRHQKQKGLVRMILKNHKTILKLPLEITLTRYAPNKLNKFDNLPMSFKWILDAICEVITGDYRPGRADDVIEDDINVYYQQVLSDYYGVIIFVKQTSKL